MSKILQYFGHFLFKKTVFSGIKKSFLLLLSTNNHVIRQLLRSRIHFKKAEMKKISLLLVAVPLLLLSCKQGDSTAKETQASEAIQASESQESLIGKKGILTYPDFKAEVTYKSENQLHWKTVNAEGVVSEGEETISYKQVGDHLFFVNWIEQDGLTVSQVIDTQKGQVDAFLSYADQASSQGERSANFIQGTFQFAE